MARIRQYTHRFNTWDQTTSAVQMKEALQHLTVPRVELQDFALEGRSLVLEQAALDARRQELTVRLKQVLQAGDTLTDLLRTGIRQHYGYQSEALVEFGIQPLRTTGRPRKPKPLPPPPSPETAAPTDSSLTPPSSPSYQGGVLPDAPLLFPALPCPTAARARQERSRAHQSDARC